MTTDILIVCCTRPVASKFNPKLIKGVVFGTKEVFLGCMSCIFLQIFIFKTNFLCIMSFFNRVPYQFLLSPPEGSGMFNQILTLFMSPSVNSYPDLTKAHIRNICKKTVMAHSDWLLLVEGQLVIYLRQRVPLILRQISVEMVQQRNVD